MRKLFIFVFSSVLILSITGCENYDYTLEFSNDLTFTQYNEFNPYDIVAYDSNNNDLVDSVVINGLELLNIQNDRITEFGSFSLRYMIIIDSKIVCHSYRYIKVEYTSNESMGLVKNSDFYGSLNDWGIVDWNNSLDVNVVNEELCIFQNSVDSYIWDQSVYQYISGLALNKTYKLVFQVTSTNDKTFRVCLAQTLPTDPYSYNVMQEKNIIVSSITDTYEIEFTTSIPSNIIDDYEFNIEEVRLEFKFGNDGINNNECSTIKFKYINIYEV